MCNRAKVFVIMQLCFAFIALCWYGLAPFMQELYSYRSRLFLTQTVLGDKELLKYAPQETEKLETMRALAKALPEHERVRLQEDADHYQQKLNSSFFVKLGRSLHILFKEIPLILLAQILTTITICFALLFRLDGAQASCWLLPALSLALLIDNTVRPMQPQTPEQQLYPSSKEIESLAQGSGARERFENGWKTWLIENWSTKAPEAASPLHRAEFALGHALIKAHRAHPTYYKAALYDKKRPAPFLFIILVWNILFAATLSKKDTYEPLHRPHYTT